MPEPTRTLITDDDLDCLDTLKADNTMSASDLYVLAPRLRARWVAEALDEASADMGSGYLRGLAAEYRDGRR